MSKDMNDICAGLNGSRVVTVISEASKPASARPRSITRRPEDALRSGNFSSLPPIKKARQLIGEALPLPSELIKGLLHLGSTMVLGGSSKTNKTFSLMDLAVSVASGCQWWGLDTIKGNVLYLDFELQEAFFRHRLDSIMRAKSAGEDALDNIEIWNLRGYAVDIDDMIDEILERIAAKHYSLIIVDPIYKALGNRDENAAGDINSFMNALDKIAVQSKASLVMGHHFSKGGQAGKESIDRMSGSGVFGRSPDALLMITKHEQQDSYTVEATLRNCKRLDPFCVSWDFPLMVRDETLDPAKLKNPGAKQEQFTHKNLLEALGDDELPTNKWKERVKTMFKMSDSSFNTKKREMVEANKIEQLDNGNWKAVEKLNITDANIARLKRESILGECSSSQNPAAVKAEGAVVVTTAAALS